MTETALPPGPRKPPWLQTLSWIRRPTAVLEDCARRFGTPFTLRMHGKPPTVVLADPESVRWVFTEGADRFQTGPTNAGFRVFAGPNSLLTLDRDPHRRHRRSLTGPFHGSSLTAVDEAAHEITRQEMGTWAAPSRFPISKAMHRITHRVIVRAIFGVHDPETTAWLIDLTARLGNGVSPLIAHFPQMRVDLGSWSPWGRFLLARNEFERFLSGEIRRLEETDRESPSILGRLVRGRNLGDGSLTDSEIRDEVLTFLAVGHETTAAALTWAWQWVLSSTWKSEIVDQIRSEVGNWDRLTFLEAAVHESLRITPPVLLLQRCLIRPSVIEGYPLPEGTLVRPSPYLTHRDERIYPEPKEFRPGRFLEGRPAPYAYYPFGGGPRACLGTAMAVRQMKVIMATVLSSAGVRLAAAPTWKARRRANGSGPRDARGVGVVRVKPVQAT